MAQKPINLGRQTFWDSVNKCFQRNVYVDPVTNQFWVNHRKKRIPVLHIGGDDELGHWFIERQTGTAVVFGDEFETLVFKEANTANKFMENNKGWGVLTVKDEIIHVAKMEDRGRRVV